MNFDHSQKIEKFFSDHEAIIDGFWDFIHDTHIYDAQTDVNDGWDNFHDGFKLAKDAGDRSVFEYDVLDGDLCLYFIGSEEEIVTRLKAGLAAYLKKYPQVTPEAKKLDALRVAKETAERELKSLQSKITSLESQEATLLAATPKKRPRKKKA